LKEGDAEQVSPLLAMAIRSELATSRPGPGVARLLRLHETARADALHDAVHEILATRREPEILVSALGALWDAADLPGVRHAATHEAWIVRAAAAKALARLGSAEDAALAAQLLSDDSWWVRYRAAQALCALAPSAEVERLVAGLTDRF